MANEEERQTSSNPAADNQRPVDSKTDTEQPVGSASGIGGQVIDSIMGTIADPDAAAKPEVVPITEDNDFVWPDEKAIFNPLCSDGVPEVPEAGDSVYKSIFTEI